jgi:hypothetical protein
MLLRLYANAEGPSKTSSSEAAALRRPHLIFLDVTAAALAAMSAYTIDRSADMCW